MSASQSLGNQGHGLTMLTSYCEQFDHLLYIFFYFVTSRGLRISKMLPLCTTSDVSVCIKTAAGLRSVTLLLCLSSTLPQPKHHDLESMFPCGDWPQGLLSAGMLIGAYMPETL